MKIELAAVFQLTKEEPWQSAVVQGREEMEFWVRFLGHMDEIIRLQEMVLSKPEAAWVTTVIQGEHPFNFGPGHPVTGHLLFYALSPQVSALGIDWGLGVLIFSRPEARAVAEKEYEEACDKMLAALYKSDWNEIIDETTSGSQ